MRTVILAAMCAALSSAQMPHPMAAGGSYIGVMMQEVDKGGVEITVVEPDSPADKGGLKVGDLVQKFNGQRVDGMQQFAHMIHDTPAGRDVKIEITRAGVALAVTVRVAQRKAPHIELGDVPQLPGRLDIHIPDMPRGFMGLRSSVLGVEAEPIDGQLAQYFGVKEGVLVRSVLKGSAAEKAAIRAGDVILKIDDARVATPADISGRLRTVHGKPVSVVLMRDHKELTIPVTIADDDPGRIQMTPFQINPN